MVANQPFVCDVDEEPGLVVLPAQKFFDSSHHPAGIIPPDSYRVVHSPVNFPHVCVVENCHPIVPNESKPDVNLLPGLFVLMRCIDEQRIDHRLLKNGLNGFGQLAFPDRFITNFDRN